MSTTVSHTPDAPTSTTHGATNHTVGIEPVSRDMRSLNAKLLNAKVMVVERYNDEIVAVVTTDCDVFRRHPLDVEAADYAQSHNAVVADPSWPECRHCGWPLDICRDPANHAWLSSANESSWR